MADHDFISFFLLLNDWIKALFIICSTFIILSFYVLLYNLTFKVKSTDIRYPDLQDFEQEKPLDAEVLAASFMRKYDDKIALRKPIRARKYVKKRDENVIENHSKSDMF